MTGLVGAEVLQRQAGDLADPGGGVPSRVRCAARVRRGQAVLWPAPRPRPGISVCWNRSLTPRSVAPPSSAPHSQRPSGNRSTRSASGRQPRFAPAAPRCLPRLRPSPPAGGFLIGSPGAVLPGSPSFDGGIDELPLLRDTNRSNRANRAASSTLTACNAAISLAWAVTSATSSSRDNPPSSDTREDHHNRRAQARTHRTPACRTRPTAPPKIVTHRNRTATEVNVYPCWLRYQLREIALERGGYAESIVPRPRGLSDALAHHRVSTTIRWSGSLNCAFPLRSGHRSGHKPGLLSTATLREDGRVTVG
jgi:hypothetical protein